MNSLSLNSKETASWTYKGLEWKNAHTVYIHAGMCTFLYPKEAAQRDRLDFFPNTNRQDTFDICAYYQEKAESYLRFLCDHFEEEKPLPDVAAIVVHYRGEGGKLEQKDFLLNGWRQERTISKTNIVSIGIILWPKNLSE